MSNSRKKWKCLDCKVDTGKIYEHYYVHLNIWLYAVGSKKGMLCISCLEKRINRKLNKNDFPNVSINNCLYSKQSQKLIDRMTKQ